MLQTTTPTESKYPLDHIGSTVFKVQTIPIFLIKLNIHKQLVITPSVCS
jgi:hypothetical protein